jgi:hypothetical protein
MTQLDSPCPLKIIQGQDFSQTLRLRLNGDGFDLTGVTEISINLLNADGTTYSSLYSAGQLNAVRLVVGQVSWTIPHAATTLLKTTDGKDVDITAVGPWGTQIFRKKLALAVLKPAV